MNKKFLQFNSIYNHKKIFCISFQRTGTTSVAEFFKVNGFKVVDWSFNRYDWTNDYVDGNYDGIFNSKKFKEFQVFEDHPWFYRDFYKVLYHRFPNAKFVLITRSPIAWFDSLVHLYDKMHVKDLSFNHFKAYGLEAEYFKLVDNSFNERVRMLIDENLKDRYIEVYNSRHREIREFFQQHDSSRIIELKLEDENKWKKLGNYFHLSDNKGLDIYANKSNK